MNGYYYIHRHLASEGIVVLGVTLCVFVSAHRAAYIMCGLHAALVSAAKIMRCIQWCSLVCVCDYYQCTRPV